MAPVDDRPQLGQIIELRDASAKPRQSLASRLPKRTLRQVFSVPLVDNKPAARGDEIPSTNNPHASNSRSGVEIAAIPSQAQNCRHHVFVEDGACLKKLDLPTAACVAVTQRFDVRAGDILSYDFVVQLNSSGDFTADRPTARAVLVNRTAESAISLMDRSLAGYAATQQRYAGSRYRDSQSFTFPASGHYELRFITLVDHRHPGSEAHLLVKSIRVLDQHGQEVRQLASLSCVGRVNHPACDESMIK
jgi:hypothetical protein